VQWLHLYVVFERKLNQKLNVLKQQYNVYFEWAFQLGKLVTIWPLCHKKRAIFWAPIDTMQPTIPFASWQVLEPKVT